MPALRAVLVGQVGSHGGAVCTPSFGDDKGCGPRADAGFAVLGVGSADRGMSGRFISSELVPCCGHDSLVLITPSFG
jgi:hypothetical protein